MKARILMYFAALTILAALMASFPLAAQERGDKLSAAPLKYTVQVLPGLGGLSGAFSINDIGWAAGVANFTGDTNEHAALWRGGQLTDLGTLGGYNSSVPFPNKNEIGWLAGISETADDDPYQENFCQFTCSSPTGGCFPFNHVCKGFLWRSLTNEMVALPPLPGGNNSYSAGANNQRQIVGLAENGVSDPNCAAPQVFRYEGVVWSLGLDGTPFVTQRLAPIAGDVVSGGVGINKLSEVVGASGPCTSIGSGIGAHAVLWKQGRAIDLGNLGGAMNNIAFAINSQRQIVGISDLPGDNVTHVFLWERGAMKDLGTLRSDDTFSFGSSINDMGEVVGFSCGPIDCRGFLWQGGVMTDLNSVLPVDSPLFITNAADINSRGEIAVQAFDQKLQDFVAAVLTPSGNNDGTSGDDAEGNNAQRKVILPANVREMLQRRPSLAGFKLSR